MFFKSTTPYREIQNWITVQLPAVYQSAKNGIDIEIKPHHNKRSNQQNRFLYAILVAIIKFHHETGFCPRGVSLWGMRVDVLKIYYKHRFGVGSTSKLDTKMFGQFIDSIQQSLVEESNGEWEYLAPDSAYIQSLINDGGFYD